MTYRLCVIGNSHVAAFKLGWDQLVDQDVPVTAEMTPTFFGAPRDGLKNLAARDGRLVPTADAVREHFHRMSGGRDEIDPADYDGFLLVGLGASMKRALRLYRTHRWFGLRQDEGCIVTSRAFATDFLAEGYAGTRLAQIARILSGLTDKPVFATPEPHWSPIMPDHVGKKGDFGWARVAASGDGAQLADLFAAAMSAALHGHVRLILQPDVTIENSIVTRAIYNKGASKMITGDGEDSDAAHMNADYGAVWWTGAASQFGLATARPRRARRSAGQRAS
jgi:hypothetical protein